MGLSTGEVDRALTLGRPNHELAWTMARDLKGQAVSMARELFEQERILEYECYDDRWNSQGRAIITLKSWEDMEAGRFIGSHGPASDGYHAWFVEHQMGLENGLYHICDCDASQCKVRKRRGDNRELIHIDKWRQLTPAAMVGTSYLKSMGIHLGESVLAAAAREKKATTPRLGTGLGTLLADAEARQEEPRKEKKRAEGRSRSPKKRESMGAFLAKQANKHADAKGVEKKKKKKDEKKGKEKKEKRDVSSDTSSGERSDSSSFELTPARGGIELWRVARKKPGQQTRLALEEMTRYLADKVESGDLETKEWVPICARLFC